ncbi:class I SAM-dependent DNA methyltransferase [Actinotalea sp. JY-7876]|uniref:class I SAM-dependent DNA methyltransferase n=1 Tax=Actinotalea sp. JY-7876 TaxID=2758442 RepID=UPI0015F3C9BB|nr:class I SAM-dependent DNA methyltransferase [Actinotalea sp. JY-7876]
MTTSSALLKRVDTGDFESLFIEELGWSNPDRRPLPVTLADGSTYTLTQVAGYKGMRVWACATLPDPAVQRAIDAVVGRDNHERLVIFTDGSEQHWRWPRRGRASVANASLLTHAHHVGDTNPHLTEKLHAITIGYDEDPSLVELMTRMRAAFDAEAETAAVRAARLMKELYTQLKGARLTEDAATLLLARLLFLLFADDTGMWKVKPDLFKSFLENHTTSATLHTNLHALFDVLNTADQDRHLPAGSPYAIFRYVNGGLFGELLALPALPAAFRDKLLEACNFDWATISPAVFGSMFQTVKQPEARRAGGEHYTTEQNILKTIGPLFLDELNDRLDRAMDDKAQLTRFINDLSKIRILDPACGCGNFLVVAYRELRALELRALIRRRDLDLLSGIHTGGINRSQMTLDVTEHVRVTLDHFFGIEIDEWPARIAGTAMLLVDHLANQNMEEEFGLAPDRLPIRLAPKIHLDNALRIDWQTVVPASADVVIVGNPPFSGDRLATSDQKGDLRRAWGRETLKHLDYVTGWYAKAAAYYGDLPGKWAFVSTNSVSQGEQVIELWQPLLRAGWRCRFAHRSFEWLTEAEGRGAKVHVSIVGFDRASTPAPQLWTYAPGGKGPGTVSGVAHINPYLLDAPDVLVRTHEKPLSPDLPEVMMGNMPRCKSLVVEAEDYTDVVADPIAAQYVRPYLGTDELVSGDARWCLWLPGVTQAEIDASPVLTARVTGSRNERLLSRAAETRKLAATPHLFAQRTQPPGPVLVIPGLAMEKRRFLTVGHFDGGVVTSNLVFCAADPDSFAFGVLSSSMFMAWMCAIGGRLKSDPRFSKTFNYNSFPLPRVSSAQRAAVVDGALAVQRARAQEPGLSLEELYEGGRLSAALEEAHAQLDSAVDAVFACTDRTDLGRQRLLLSRYAKMTAGLPV